MVHACEAELYNTVNSGLCERMFALRNFWRLSGSERAGRVISIATNVTMVGGTRYRIRLSQSLRLEDACEYLS